MDQIELKSPIDGNVIRIIGNAQDESIFQPLRRSKGRYHFGLTKLLIDTIRDDFVCLDIGANIGLVSLFMAQLAPQGQVYAFEPCPGTRKYLVQNLLANNLTNVTPVALAMMDCAQTIGMLYDDSESGGARIAGSGEGDMMVQAVSLDEWVKEVGLTRLDFLKIDVEGAEPFVIDGARNVLAKFQPDAVVEFNPLVMKQLFAGRSFLLYEQLASIYPRIYIVSDLNSPILIESSDALAHHLASSADVIDLYCTFKNKELDLRYSFSDKCYLWAKKFKASAKKRCYLHFQPRYLIEIQSVPQSIVEDTNFVVPLKLTNLSAVILRAKENPQINLSYHIFDERGECVVFDGLRTVLSQDILPNQTISIECNASAPNLAGVYRIQFSLVQESFAWLNELDPSLLFECELTVMSAA